MQKDKVMEMVNQLPSEFELEDFIDRLILIEKVEEANKQIESGEFYTQEDVERMSKKW